MTPPKKPAISDALTTVLLIAIVLSSAALSLHWVFRTPFFQQPDENAHADYAFTLYTAGHLIRARDGIIGTDVHPYTRYLERVSNFRAIRFNPDGRVPAGYGTAAFYRSVDAAKPRVGPRLFEAPNHPVPYVAAVYPFVFYALAAATATAASWITSGSLTAMFFAMRLLCVALMAAMLLFSYATMRALHLDRVRSLLLTAAIGCFPLVSWHGAYIQPDNLACAAVAACLYVTLRVSRFGLDSRRLVALGYLLALVSITKPPYFVAVGAAAVFVVAARLGHMRGTRRPVLVWGVLLVPSVVMLTLAHYYAQSPSFGSMLAASQSSPISSAFERSMLAGVGASAAELTRAWWSTYGFGATSAGFWHGFSWLDELIEIGSFQLTFTIHMLIVVVTLLIIALMLRRQCLVYGRLLAVARERSISRALSVLAGDPVLNSYLIFAAIMILLDAFTNRALSSNRYWVVFITGAFLCGVWYAPRSLPKGRYGNLGTTVLALLLAFSLVSIPFSWRSLERRYYDPVPPNHVHVETTAGIWSPSGAVDVERGDHVRVQGWAFDSTSGLPEGAAYFVVDERQRVPVTYGLAEPQFAIRMHDDALLASGFSAEIPTAALSQGDHTARLFVLDHARTRTYPTTLQLSFTVLSASAR
ncbi:MAG TPA: DUF2142 domain-containing protein [Candidatus Acidoferrales bacterium]|nr:DUF2142 domain-containing protein [Candidatus Acidoferrales bacterium]